MSRTAMDIYVYNISPHQVASRHCSETVVMDWADMDRLRGLGSQVATASQTVRQLRLLSRRCVLV